MLPWLIRKGSKMTDKKTYLIGILSRMSWRTIYIISLIISIFVATLSFFNDGAGGDFMVYHRVAREVLSGDIPSIYDPQPDGMVYRYFPFFAVLMVPFGVANGRIAFVLFSFLSIMSIMSMISQIRKIGETLKINGNVTKFCCLFVGCSLFFSAAIIVGQAVILASFFIVLSFRLLLEKREVLSAVSLGFSMVIKPVALFVVLLHVLYYLSHKEIKATVKFLVFLALPLVPDAILFFSPSSGLITTFLSNSAAVDIRMYWTYIAGTSLVYYWLNVYWTWTLVMFFPPCLIIMMYKMRQFNVVSSLSFVYSLGVVFHFMFMDVTHTSIPMLTLPFLLFFMASRPKWQIRSVCFTLAMQVLLVSSMSILPYTLISFMIQLFAMFAWIVVFYAFMKNPPKFEVEKG